MGRREGEFASFSFLISYLVLVGDMQKKKDVLLFCIYCMRVYHMIYDASHAYLQTSTYVIMYFMTLCFGVLYIYIHIFL